MSFKKPIFYEYKLEKMSGVDLLGVMHIDDRNNDSIELKVTQGGTAIDLTGAAVTARIVTRKTHVLINDNVPCSVNESGNILIPLDRPNVETVKGDLKIEINITNSGGGITLQFPLWVRVNGSILDGAEVTSESKGTIPELIEDVEEELRRVQGFITSDDVYDILDSTLQGAQNVTPSLYVKRKGDNYALVYEDSDDVLHELFDFSNLPSGGTSPLADKNIVVFGDSLTDPQSGGISWTESFINIAEYNSFRGYGRGYCTWTFKNNTEYNITDNTDANVGSNVIWNQFNKLKHDVDNNNTPIPDIIMIFCADNDILQSKTIGSESATFKAEAQSSDVKTLTNMMDSIRYNIDTINTEYPNCIIVPIIPLLPSQYAKSKTYRDALITCYNNLGLSYIDVMYGSGIAWYREVMKKTYYTGDGVHLSEAGSMKVAKLIYQSLITMPRIQKLPSTTTNKGLYNVYYNFTNATSTNSFASVMQGEPYRAIISATTGYSLTSVTCTMGGVSQPVEAGVINIASVSGNIVVTAVASPDQPTTTYTVTNNLTNATNSNAATSVTQGDSYTATISANQGYHMMSVVCTMGGAQQTVTDNTINIAEVTGNIVITAVAEQDQPTVYYTVTNNLTNATNSNAATSVEGGASYTATISANQGYHMMSVVCTMGGAQQTVTDNTINIAEVTGNIVITAVAEQDQPTVYYTVTNNLTNATNSNAATSVEGGASYTATISANQGYHMMSVVCTMGGAQQTVTDNTINIAEVTGNIVITAVATQFVPVEGAYIHNDGDCWIGSSYYPTQATTRLELVADVHSFSGNFGYLVGSTSTKLCQWYDEDTIACVAGGAAQKDPDLVSLSYDKKFTLDADIANKVLTIADEDGTRTSRITVGTDFVRNPMWYFAGYWNKAFEHKSGDMKIYSLKIWEGDTLVYAGYPVSDSNGAGIHDAITGTTNYNEGTGTLTYGVDSAS